MPARPPSSLCYPACCGPIAGTITLLGRDITARAAARAGQAGLVRTFQISSLFRSLTVLENVYLAVSEHLGTSRNACGAPRSATAT